MDKKHVFIDWYEVDPAYGVDAPGYRPKDGSPYGVKIKIHKPILDETPLLTPDLNNAWENPRVGAFATIIKIKDTYHMWYEALAIPWSLTYCYATSKDGIHWEKPNLGLCEYNGSKNNNIIRIDSTPDHCDEGEAIIYQEDAPENERFKMVFTRVQYDNGKVTEVAQHGAISADGIHWEETGKIFVGGDCQASFIYDVKRKKYVVMSKSQDPDHLIRRTMIYTESDDFRHFSEPRLILNGDPTDPPDVDYYDMALHAWKGTDDAFVYFPAAFHRTNDIVDTIFACSRDFYTINRPLGFEPLFKKETAPDIYAVQGMTEENGRWYHYCCLMPTGHNEGAVLKGEKKYAGFRRFYYREDGYTSLNAESHGGITTIPLQFGKGLKLNAKIQTYGYIKIAVTDGENTVLDGFGFDDCKLTPIDDLHYAVEWRKPLSSLDLNQRYRLKMQLFKCDIYAYTFTDCPDEETGADKQAAYRV
ncbi:MAG: hypothetical protein IJY62_00770 [Clostridia bacterium]|nr:hypothetical protein [Clostridia bacterium]